MSELREKRCIPCEGGVDPLSPEQVETMLGELDGWKVDASSKMIEKDFEFENFYKTMAFVNALAYMAHIEDHHPDLEVGYGHCLVRYTTHAIDGLSENDFICAAKVDAIMAEASGDAPACKIS